MRTSWVGWRVVVVCAAAAAGSIAGEYRRRRCGRRRWLKKEKRRGDGERERERWEVPWWGWKLRGGGLSLLSPVATAASSWPARTRGEEREGVGGPSVPRSFSLGCPLPWVLLRGGGVNNSPVRGASVAGLATSALVPRPSTKFLRLSLLLVFSFFSYFFSLLSSLAFRGASPRLRNARRTTEARSYARRKFRSLQRFPRNSPRVSRLQRS